MILLIKLLAGLAFIMFVVDLVRADNKKKFFCELIGHKWFTNEGCTFCLRCMENKATTLSQQRKKLLERNTERRKQERKAKNVVILDKKGNKFLEYGEVDKGRFKYGIKKYKIEKGGE